MRVTLSSAHADGHLASTRAKIQPHSQAPAYTTKRYFCIYSMVQMSESMTDLFFFFMMVIPPLGCYLYPYKYGTKVKV